MPGGNIERLMVWHYNLVRSLNDGLLKEYGAQSEIIKELTAVCTETLGELEKWESLGDYSHIRELVQAEKENRLRILKPANENTCGMCKNFVPGKGAYGRCAIREFQVNKWGQKTGREFVPGRSRTACRKDFVRKEDD